MTAEVTTTPHRARVADFWDSYVDRWLNGDESLTPQLQRWFDGYKGNGRGELNLNHYPDPYVGDLRGIVREPKFVVLGINPGIGYDGLQSRDGIWARRVKESSLSTCFSRSPEEDPVAWLQYNRTRSRYWVNLLNFVGLWLSVPKAKVADVLSLELYPWHSRGINGTMKPPADLAWDFVFSPISEMKVRHVFAFSSAWRNIAESLALERIFEEVLAFNAKGHREWTLSVYKLSSSQMLVVSTRANAIPPLGASFTKLIEKLEAIS